ncbi:MAG: 1-acyl-sn-glycerol-3-phosphate acyltransferase [Acidimicrobiales bacterium]
METPPPRWVRRLILTPITFVGALCLVILSPLIHLIAAAIDLLVDRGRWRVSRLVGIGLAFCVVEVFGLFALLTVWIGSGFGRLMKRPFWVRANTVLLGQYFELITRAIRFYLGFTFSYTVDPIPPGPQLLFSRHAGPGDAFLIARAVIRDLGRRVHMVGAAKLQWDPFLDVSGERLGFHYLPQNPTDRLAELDKIKGLASELEPDETLVIFPEGGNYTPGRRARSLELLQDRGRHEKARRAEQLKHTLLPRTGGVISAIEGAPGATVVLMAHAGLENLHGFGDLWASIPLHRSVEAHAWAAPIDRWPTDRTGQETWLFDHWEVVDDWIDHRISR